MLWSVCRIVVHAVVAEQRDKPLQVLGTDAKVLCLKYLDGRMYAGLKNGTLLIYSRGEGTCGVAYNRVACTVGWHELWGGM